MLGATRWPGDFNRAPILEAYWQSYSEKQLQRLGDSVAGRTISSGSCFIYGNQAPPPGSTEFLRDVMSQLKISYELPHKLLVQQDDSYLTLTCTDLGSWREDEIVYAVRIQRWYPRVSKQRKQLKRAKAVHTLQRAFRGPLKRVILAKAFRARKVKRRQEAIAQFTLHSKERRRCEAAVEIQRSVKQFLIFRRKYLIKRDRQLMSAHLVQKIDAATMIQKHWRGCKQYKKYKKEIREVHRALANRGFAVPAWALIVMKRYVARWRVIKAARLAEEARIRKLEEEEAMRLARIQAAKDALNDTSDDITRPIVEGDYVLWVVEGKELPNIESYGTSDPYVTVRYNGKKIGSTKVTFQPSL
jgi:hypothetical protein